jgi:hypothetical protein
MAQKCLRRWIFVKPINRHLCKTILKTVNRVITPDEVYTPTRVLHGTRNATQHMQFVLVIMIDGIKSSITVWLDDYLHFTKTGNDLLATPNFF